MRGRPRRSAPALHYFFFDVAGGQAQAGPQGQSGPQGQPVVSVVRFLVWLFIVVSWVGVCTSSRLTHDHGNHYTRDLTREERWALS